MAGQSSGEDTPQNSPTSAGTRTQRPPLFSPLSSSLCSQVMPSCKGLKGGRSCLGWVLLRAVPAPSPAMGSREQPPRRGLARPAKSRLCVSVYLCYSETVPCHWDRKQLWTEISAYDGNVSSVMLFHIFFKAWLSANWHIYMLAL